MRTVERLMEQMNKRIELSGSWIDTGVDLTLIAQGLRASPEERLARATGFARGAMRMRQAFIESQQ